MQQPTRTRLRDFQPTRRAFLQDVLAGLRQQPKRFPCKYFYDQRGSALFEEICGLDEYYLTRAEMEIMHRDAVEMAKRLEPEVMLIELGSGGSIKTRLLLKELQPAVYVPVDISRKHLHQSAETLSREFPHVEVAPVCADFTDAFSLPATGRDVARRVVYFPGSTIGNFQPLEASQLLRRIAHLCDEFDGEEPGGLLIGIDLKKEAATLEAAYNDRRGVTAQFNLNLLARINRELGGQFDLEQFQHRACYNAEQGRIEMHLVSRGEQTVALDGEVFSLAAGETICTEYSHKYSVEQFAEMAAESDWVPAGEWMDEKRQFAVLYFQR